MLFEKGLSRLGLPSKLLITLFLCTMGLGYIFSLYTLYVAHKDADGDPDLSMKDIIVTYSGIPRTSRLEIAALGSMAAYFSSEIDKNAVVAWIRAGADKARFDETALPILNKSCITCHSPEGGKPDVPLTTYDEVMKYVGKSSGGITPLRLGSLSHTHLISHGMMFFFLSLIFLMTRVKDHWKIILVFLAYFGIVVDVAAWWLAKTAVFFAYFIVIGGGVLGVTFLFFFFVPMGELWIKRK